MGVFFRHNHNHQPCPCTTRPSKTQLNSIEAPATHNCQPQTRARTHAHTTQHNTPSMTCPRFGPTRGSRSTRTWPAWLAYCSYAGVFCRPGEGLLHGRASHDGGTQSSLSAAYAEIVMFLNRNIEYILIEVPALSTEQALQTAPRRLSKSPTRRRRWPPFLRARRGLRAKRALTPAAVTPQGKARARSLGDEWGAAVDILCCCHVSACSSLFCFFWAMHMIFFIFASCVFCLFGTLW